MAFDDSTDVPIVVVNAAEVPLAKDAICVPSRGPVARELARLLDEPSDGSLGPGCRREPVFARTDRNISCPI